MSDQVEETVLVDDNQPVETPETSMLPAAPQNFQTLAAPPQNYMTLNRPRSFLDLSNDELGRISKLANVYALSGLSRMKKGENIEQKEAEFKLIMLKGLELGMMPMAAVDMIDVINGKPVISAKGLLALAYASGELEDIQIDSTDTYCTVIITRRGKSPHMASFTKQDAQKFKVISYEGWNETRKKVESSLWDKDTWQSMPAVMLQWRAVSTGLRTVFPDKIAGLYTKEEMIHTIPGTIIVREDGEMEIIRDDEPPTPATPPTPPAPPKPAAYKNPETRRIPTEPKDDENIVDKKNAGSKNDEPPKTTNWAESDLGKKQITGKLSELGLAKDDYPAYLKELGVDRFGAVQHKDFKEFAAAMDAIALKLNPAKPKGKKSDKKADEKPADDANQGERYSFTCDIVEYANLKKGTRNNYSLVFNGFTSVGSVHVYGWSRNTFVELLQKHDPAIEKWLVYGEDGSEHDITQIVNPEPGKSHMYEMDPVEIFFELTDKTGSDSKKIGKLVDAKPAIKVDDADVPDDDDEIESAEDLFDSFFGDEDK
jgi:RecT family